MKLYATDHSPFVLRVRLAARAKSIELALVEPPDGPGSGAFRTLSPLGKVPVLELEDGRRIPESEVIVELMEDLRPHPALRPADPVERARARLLARIADLELAEALHRLFEEAKRAEPDLAAGRDAAAAVRRGLALLEHHLGAGPYAAGGAFSTADCALAPLLFFAERCTGVCERLGAGAPFRGLGRLEEYWAFIRRDPHCSQLLDELDAVQRRRAEERARTGTNRIR